MDSSQIHLIREALIEFSVAPEDIPLSHQQLEQKKQQAVIDAHSHFAVNNRNAAALNESLQRITRAFVLLRQHLQSINENPSLFFNNPPKPKPPLQEAKPRFRSEWTLLRRLARLAASLTHDVKTKAAAIEQCSESDLAVILAVLIAILVLIGFAFKFMKHRDFRLVDAPLFEASFPNQPSADFSLIPFAALLPQSDLSFAGTASTHIQQFENSNSITQERQSPDLLIPAQAPFQSRPRRATLMFRHINQERFYSYPSKEVISLKTFVRPPPAPLPTVFFVEHRRIPHFIKRELDEIHSWRGRHATANDLRWTRETPMRPIQTNVIGLLRR